MCASASPWAFASWDRQQQDDQQISRVLLAGEDSAAEAVSPDH